MRSRVRPLEHHHSILFCFFFGSYRSSGIVVPARELIPSWISPLSMIGDAVLSVLFGLLQQQNSLR